MAEISPADLSARQGFPGVLREFRFPVNVLGSASEAVMADQLPTRGVLMDAYVEVVTAEATAAAKTVSFGIDSSETGGDADGFEADVDVSATGIQRLDGGALWTAARHILDGVARTPSATPAGADFAELVANVYFLVFIPAEVL